MSTEKSKKERTKKSDSLTLPHAVINHLFFGLILDVQSPLRSSQDDIMEKWGLSMPMARGVILMS